jgi:hypothetical protein
MQDRCKRCAGIFAISGVFEMNKRHLGRQREDRIVVAEQEILHKIVNPPRTSIRRLANLLKVSLFVVWLRVQNATQEIRENRASLSRVQLSWARRAETCIANHGRDLNNFFDVSFCAFTHNYSLFTLLFKSLLFSE